MQNTHGGAGRGQGRKPLPPDSVLKVGSIRLTQRQWDKLARMGGARIIRKYIELYKEVS